MDEESRRKRQADMEAQHNRIIEIGGMRFGEGVSDYGHEREAAHQNRDTSKDITIPTEAVTLAEAHQIFDFTFGIPTWLPDGYTIDEKVSISGLSKGSRTPHIAINGTHPDRRRFNLSIRLHKNVPDIVYGPLPVEENGLSEIQVNGQPAALIRPQKSYRAATGEPFIVDLVWMIGDVQYRLSCAASVLSTTEMIRIAESVRHDAT
jgi:hypothetical protein